MPETHPGPQVEIVVFGSLQLSRQQKGLPARVFLPIPESGAAAHSLLEAMGISPTEVEAVFRNGRVVNIYDPVFPGDRVAFFPYGTPGPYRVFLGMARENIRRAEKEQPAPEKGTRT